MKRMAPSGIIFISIALLLASSRLLAQDYTELDCLVKPEMYINVSSPTNGVLESVLVKKSDMVKKGQVLAKLAASVEQSKVALAEQEARMDNLIQTKQTRYDFIERKKARLISLYKNKVLSAQDYDETVTESDLAKAELLQAKQDKKTNDMKLALAKAELEQKIIKSPIDGLVIETYLMPGESVDTKPVLQLAKINPLLVEVVAPASLFGKIYNDMPVEIHPDAPANSQYQAKVNIVDKIIDAASGSFSVRLALPNPDAQLVGGTKCIAKFPIKPDPATAKTASKSADEQLPDDIKALLR